MATVKQLVDPTVGITCHAWSPSRTELAFSPNSHELRIVDASTLATKFSLTEHDMLISAIDWHPETNFIVTCSHDRNAFVWNYDADEGAWKPSLVILRIERAALAVQWSPDGQKFAVGSSAKCVPVCYYEKDNNWWVSKMIKKHKSSVLTVAWHPNSQILATGASDFKARVFSAFVNNVDAAQQSAEFPSSVAFGETYAEFASSGWVHGVCYSPSGQTLAFAGHDSSVHFATFGSEGAPTLQTIRFAFLPLQQLYFASETTIIAGGHDRNPAVFEKGESSSHEWAFAEFVDKKPKATSGSTKSSSDVKSRMAMWQNKDKTGKEDGAAADDESKWLKHQGPITCLKPYKHGFSTTSPDGRLVLWPAVV